MDMQSCEGRELRRYRRSDVPRLRWCPHLHHSFVKAVKDLGGRDEATPRMILELMNVEGLTIPQIKSHLQTYRSREEENEPKNHDCKSKCFLQQQILSSQELYSTDKVNTTRLSLKRLWQEDLFPKEDETRPTNLQGKSSDRSDVSKSYGAGIQGDSPPDSSLLNQSDIGLPKLYRENHTEKIISDLWHKKRKFSLFSDHKAREEFHATRISSSSCKSRKRFKSHEMERLVDLFLQSQQCEETKMQKRSHMKGPFELQLIQRQGQESGKSEDKKENEWQCEIMDIDTKTITTTPVDINCLLPLRTNFRTECTMKLDLTMSI